MGGGFRTCIWLLNGTVCAVVLLLFALDGHALGEGGMLRGAETGLAALLIVVVTAAVLSRIDLSGHGSGSER